MELADRLEALADKMDVKIKEQRNPSKQNYTARRARIAAGMWREAERLEKIQYALYALARREDVDPLLEGIKTRAAVESVLFNTQWPMRAGDEKRLVKAGLSEETFLEARDKLKAMILKPDNSEERNKREQAVKERELVRRIPGYFPTPKDVVEQMLSYVQPQRVLDPSCGAGAILDVVENCETFGYEINYTLANMAMEKGHIVECVDFLSVPVQEWSCILMNPPFEREQDIDHVLHAYRFLKGTLVAVMSEGTFSRNTKKAVAFREFLSENGYAVELPVDAFRESGTGVKARLVILS